MECHNNKQVEEFWAALNITSSAIPNEMLLRLYDYHGLRHAIYKQGGCVFGLSVCFLGGGEGGVHMGCMPCMYV